MAKDTTKEFKNSYVFATPTGFKVVNKDTLVVTKHVGTKEELELHEKTGTSKGSDLNEIIAEQEKERKSNLEKEAKKDAEKAKKDKKDKK